MNQKGLTTVQYILIGLVVVLLGVGVYFVWDSNKEEETAQDTTSTSENVEDETSTPVDEENEAPQTEETALVAVGEYTGSGVATRTVSGEYIHTVTAQLGDPAEGDFYEGWLVGPSVVSTGELTQEVEGEWSLVFTSSEDLSEHNEIVITEETKANGLDGVPEDHVLEGNFSI